MSITNEPQKDIQREEEDDDTEYSSFAPEEKNYLKKRLGECRYNNNILVNKEINIECEKIRKLIESVIYLAIYQMDKDKVCILEVNDDLLNMFFELTSKINTIKELFAKKAKILY